MKLRQVISIMLCVTLMISTTSVANVYAADEYDSLRNYILTSLTGGSGLDISDPYIEAKITLIDEKALKEWSSQNSFGVWDDWMDASATDPGAIKIMYDRLRSMALAWSSENSLYYQDSGLELDIEKGLDWLYTNRYNENQATYGNWWYWDIGIPHILNEVTVLMYSGLSASQVTNYMNAVDHFVPNVERTGANLVDSCEILIISGIITKDGVRIQEGSDGLSDVLAYVTAGDGFYTDGSFIQHDDIPYAGSYGAALLSAISHALAIVSGSTWDNTDPLKANIYEWIFDTFETSLYDGAVLNTVKGRRTSGYGVDGVGNAMKIGLFRSIYDISTFVGNPYAEDMKGLIKYHIQSSDEQAVLEYVNLYYYDRLKDVLDDNSVVPRTGTEKNMQFYNQDVTTHAREDWLLTLSMHSSRTANRESINGENLKGWYQGDGVTYVMQNNNDYLENYFSTVDSHRLPGITVDIDRNRPALPDRTKSSSDRDFVGGVTFDGLYGLTSMDFKQHHYSNMDVEAKKSWFMFDNEVVALGSGITSTSGRTIETVIDNRSLGSYGDNLLTIDGTAKSSTSGWSEVMSDITWAHLEGTGGYYFPDKATISGLREERTGRHEDINTLNTYSGYDEFDETLLDSIYNITNEDESRWQISQGQLVITTTQGSLEDALNNPVNLITKKAPRGDYQTTVKLDFSPTQAGHEAGMLVWLDEDNYVSMTRANVAGNNEFVFAYEVNGSRTSYNVADTLGNQVYLRIVREGDFYSGYYSSDNVNWSGPVHTFTDNITTPIGGVMELGFIAQNGMTATAEIDASFDYIDVEHTKDFLTLWQDHGIDPTDDTYSYVLLPTMLSSEVAAYSTASEITVIENSNSVHSVLENTLNIQGTSFWEAEGDSVGFISSRNASTIMSKDTGSEIEIAVSDPTQKQGKVTVELRKSGTAVVSSDPEVTVLRLTPTILFEVDTTVDPGKTYNIKLSYDGQATNLVPNGPTGLVGTYTGGSIDLLWDQQEAVDTYSVYRSISGVESYQLIASGLTHQQYSDTAVEAAQFYDYKITGTNVNGESDDSRTLTIESVLRETVSLEPTADAFVQGGSTEYNNYGSQTYMNIKKSTDPAYEREAYVKFDVSQIAVGADKILKSATLYLHGYATGTSLVEAHSVSDDSWQENTINYNNKPAGVNLQSTVSIGTSRQWHAFDVTTYVLGELSGDETVSLLLKDISGGWSQHDTKEGTNKPYLELVYEDNATLIPVEDSYARGGTYSDNTYGTEADLHIRQESNGDWTRESYLKLDLNQIPQNKIVKSAKLYLYGKAFDNPSTVDLYSSVDDSWDESTLTYNTKPTLSNLVESKSIDTTEGWKSYDITSAVKDTFQTDQILSLGMVTAENIFIRFDSTEGANKPYVKVVFESEIQVTPSEDAFVRGGVYTDNNYGSDTTLRAKSVTPDYTRHSFLKFDLNGQGIGDETTAKLYLYGRVNDSKGTVADVQIWSVDDDSWQENAITFTNQPAMMTLIDTTTVGDTYQWHVIDVSSYVRSQLTGTGIVTLGIKDTAGLYSVYDSREGVNKPYLVIN